VIVDSSAIVAISREEPSFQTYLEAVLRSPVPRISAANLLEAAIVIDRLPNPRAAVRFDDLIQRLKLVIESVTLHQVSIAREAYRQFGKGSGHRARLNFGDCFAYALAKNLDEPLLFIGQDFVHTDIRPALDDAWMRRCRSSPIPTPS
jgi:ribonuclease VapC